MRPTISTLSAVVMLVVSIATSAPKVLAQEFQQQITKSFTEPIEISDVAAAEQGIVAKVNVKEGQSIKAGDVLAELDSDVLNQSRRLAEAKATSHARIDAATALLRLQETQKRNFEELSDEGHANPSEVTKVQAEYSAAVAELELARDDARQNQIELDLIDAQLRRRQIVSPMDAVVTALHRQKGEFISASDPILATIVRLDRLKVRFYLQAAELNALQPGGPTQVLVGSDRRPVMATVDFISPVIDPDSATARVDLSIENSDLEIRSGEVCEWSGASPESLSTSLSSSQSPARLENQD